MSVIVMGARRLSSVDQSVRLRSERSWVRAPQSAPPASRAGVCASGSRPFPYRPRRREETQGDRRTTRGGRRAPRRPHTGRRPHGRPGRPGARGGAGQPRHLRRDALHGRHRALQPVHALQRRQRGARGPRLHDGLLPQHALPVRGGRERRHRHLPGAPQQAGARPPHHPRRPARAGAPGGQGGRGPGRRCRPGRPRAPRPRGPGPLRLPRARGLVPRQRVVAHRRVEAPGQGTRRHAALGLLRRVGLRLRPGHGRGPGLLRRPHRRRGQDGQAGELPDHGHPAFHRAPGHLRARPRGPGAVSALLPRGGRLVVLRAHHRGRRRGHDPPGAHPAHVHGARRGHGAPRRAERARAAALLHRGPGAGGRPLPGQDRHHHLRRHDRARARPGGGDPGGGPLGPRRRHGRQRRRRQRDCPCLPLVPRGRGRRRRARRARRALLERAQVLRLRHRGRRLRGGRAPVPVPRRRAGRCRPGGRGLPGHGPRAGRVRRGRLRRRRPPRGRAAPPGPRRRGRRGPPLSPRDPGVLPGAGRAPQRHLGRRPAHGVGHRCGGRSARRRLVGGRHDAAHP